MSYVVKKKKRISSKEGGAAGKKESTSANSERTRNKNKQQGNHSKSLRSKVVDTQMSLLAKPQHFPPNEPEKKNEKVTWNIKDQWKPTTTIKLNASPA